MPRIHKFSAKYLFNPTRMDDLIKLRWTLSKAQKLTGQAELDAFIKVFRSKRTGVAQALSPVKQAASSHSLAGSLGDNLRVVGALTKNKVVGGIIAGQIKRYIDGNYELSVHEEQVGGDANTYRLELWLEGPAPSSGKMLMASDDTTKGKILAVKANPPAPAASSSSSAGGN